LRSFQIKIAVLSALCVGLLLFLIYLILKYSL